VAAGTSAAGAGAIATAAAATAGAVATGGGGDATPVEIGAKLFQEKACFTCHLNAPGGIGPILTNVPGHEVELSTGEKVLADDAYLRESILTPMAKTVKGYPPAMPTFQGQLSEEQVMALIAYIKSLGGSAPGAAATH
jgi:cytochrome c oxidase subunit 2